MFFIGYSLEISLLTALAGGNNWRNYSEKAIQDEKIIVYLSPY
jgi:hypothetical protein